MDNIIDTEESQDNIIDDEDIQDDISENIKDMLHLLPPVLFIFLLGFFVIIFVFK